MKRGDDQQAWARVGLGVLLSIASAVLLTLAFPPYNLGWLIWVAFVPMLIAQYRIMPRRFTSLAPAIAVGGWLVTFLIPVFGGKSLVMTLLPLAIAAVILFTDKGKRAFHERTDYRWFVLEGAAGWVGLEMIRSFIPVIGTWGFVGYTLWSASWFLQPLSLFGIFALDLLILLGNYAFAQLVFLVVGLPDSVPISRPQAVRWVADFLILLGAWIGLSLSLYAAQPANRLLVRVAAIQPNLPRAAHRDTTTTSERRLNLLSDQIRSAADNGAKIIVLPEMAFNFDPPIDYSNELKSLAAETKAFLVIGMPLNPKKASAMKPSSFLLLVSFLAFMARHTQWSHQANLQRLAQAHILYSIPRMAGWQR